MATLQELERAFVKADEAGNTEDAQAFATEIKRMRGAAPPPVAEAKKDEPVRTTLDRVIGGMADLAAGAGQVGTAILAPYDLAADAVQGRKLGTGNRERRQSIEDFAKEHGENNWTSVVNQAAPEMIVTGGPLGGVERGVVKAIEKAAPNAVRTARLAGAGADVATNSAYAAAQAAARGEDPADAATAGALGSLAGRGAVRVAGGALRPVVSKEAQTLVDAGITPTPGQAIGGVFRKAEDASTSIPGWGDTVQWGRSRAAKQYVDSEVNRAILPIGGKVKTGMGDTAEEVVERARQIVSNSYDDVLPRTYIAPSETTNALSGWARSKDSVFPLLTGSQNGQLDNYLTSRVFPILEAARRGGQDLPGELVKEIDSEIGHYARKYSGSVNPADHHLGEAFYDMQATLRDSLKGADSTAIAQLKATNQAYRNMLPVIKASDRAAGQGGQFSPLQMHQASDSFDQTASDVTRAARQVLPSTIPDSGTARRLMTGGGAALIGAGKPLAIGGAIGAMVNSPVGLNALIHGVRGIPGVRSTLVPKVREWFDMLPPEKQAEFIAKYAEATPSINQMAAQIGRVMGTQPEGDQP